MSSVNEVSDGTSGFDPSAGTLVMCITYVHHTAHTDVQVVPSEQSAGGWEGPEAAAGAGKHGWSPWGRAALLSGATGSFAA